MIKRKTGRPSYKSLITRSLVRDELALARKRRMDRKAELQRLVDEVKSELAADRLAESRMRVKAVAKKPFKPAMTFWLSEDRFKGAFPVLKNRKK